MFMREPEKPILAQNVQQRAQFLFFFHRKLLVNNILCDIYEEFLNIFKQYVS